MSLTVPNLDDRRFQDIVDEAKRMIPELVPEWTNHNVADPGVALIELFAWMSEQVIYRLNQVPDKLYVDFLNLVGTVPFPAAAARVPLTFRLAGIPDEPVIVPAGTEVTTEHGGVVFATLDELRIGQPELVAAYTSVGEGTFVDVLPELRYDRDAVAAFASEPVAPDDALNLGFAESLAGQIVELEVSTTGRGVGVDPDDPPLAWEAWSGEHWLACEVLLDTTGGLNRDGRVQVTVPASHEALVLGGERCYWVRVRLRQVREGQATFRSSPMIGSLEVSTTGGSVVAEHARTVVGEVVGSSDGTPGQRFTLVNRPLLPRREGEHVTVTLQDVDEQWTEVVSFARSLETDRHVVFDDAQGTIEFGPRVRYPDGRSVQHGAVPAFGAQISLSRYRTGGGGAGNVGASTLTRLTKALPFVDEVTNLVPARGGVDAESEAEVKVRGPRTLRTGRRAVTPSDYEQIALEASPQVARARCVPPTAVGDAIRLLIVPHTDQAPDSLVLDDLALTTTLFATVAARIERRRTIGAQVAVTAPYYQGVSVVGRVRAVAGRSPAAVKDRATMAIARYLSPLTGGPSGTGWEFGVDLKAALLASLLEDVPGVSAVDELALFEFDLRNRTRLGDPLDAITLDPESLFLSGRTQVVVR